MKILTLWTGLNAAVPVLAQIPPELKTGFQAGLGVMFLVGFPKLRDYYNGLSKDELIRKLMLLKMERQEYRAGRNEEIRAWVEERPEIKAKIEERIRNVPAEKRERAFINAAKTEAQNQAIRSSGPRP